MGRGLANHVAAGRLETQRTLVLDYRSHVARFGEIAEYLDRWCSAALMLRGRHDVFFDLEETLAWRKALPRMGAHILDGPHFLLETHPSECAALMGAFIERVERHQSALSMIEAGRWRVPHRSSLVYPARASSPATGGGTDMPDVSRARASIEVFFSYSHKDEELRDELSKHLSLLKRTHVITGWHDRRIGAGNEWSAEIDRHLDAADVILLLVSSDFLASDYCYDVEVRKAMERHDARQARVIPVILRPVDWKGAPFGRLQALPRDARPVTSWSNRDDAFLDVAEGIRVAVRELTIGKVGHLIDKLSAAESLGNWPNAIDLGERILGVLPDDESVRTRTAAAYVKRWSGRFGQDIDDLGRMEIRKKRNEVYQQIIGKIVEDLDRAIQLDPGNAEYYFLRGSVVRFGSFEGCDLGYERFIQRGADFDRAIERNPASPRYHYARAFEDKLEGNYEAALCKLRRALELGYPEKHVAFEQGRVYEELKDFQAALEKYERAKESGHPVARIKLEGLSMRHPALRKR